VLKTWAVGSFAAVAADVSAANAPKGSVTSVENFDGPAAPAVLDAGVAEGEGDRTGFGFSVAGEDAVSFGDFAIQQPLTQ
jgi:hypothetical protein